MLPLHPSWNPEMIRQLKLHKHASVNKRIKSIKTDDIQIIIYRLFYHIFNLTQYSKMIHWIIFSYAWQLKPSLKTKTASQYYSGLQRQLPGYGQIHQSS